jgi:hypothetical protein
MSSITPPSFVDDGSSFEKRMAHGLHPTQISKWLHSSGSDTTSVYTGSYIDDGADMLVPPRHAPGFGPINPKFYKQRKKREDGERGIWNDDIRKAVVGDIGRSLEKMRGIGGVEVKRVDRGEGKVKEKEKRKDTVTVPLPQKWGTIVIKDDDGRVIVVDEDGEFDSGPRVKEPEETPVESKWIKALSTIDLPPLSSPLARHASEKRDHGKRSTRKHKHIQQPVKPLTSIPESEYEDGYQPSGGEDLMSPTGFFMTGGASGWPSPEPTSIVSPAKSRSSRKQPPSIKENLKSPVRSPPGSWPSPPQSPTKSSSISDESMNTGCSVQSWGKKSHRSGKSHKSSRDEGNNGSTKTCSTYKPATVEDAPETSSDQASVLKNGEWGGSQKESLGGWGGSNKASEHNWNGSTDSSHKSSRHSTNVADFHDTWAPSDHHLAPSVIQNWVGDRVKTVSEASSHESRSLSHQRRNHSRAPSETGWDGYEKPKTMSEVSVVGTESEQNWPGSRTSSRHSRWSKALDHRSHRSSRHGSQARWEGSERERGGSQEANIDGWRGKSDSGSRMGGEGYANGYDENNETYLNEDWGGVKVRVGSRRGSVVGWE